MRPRQRLIPACAQLIETGELDLEDYKQTLSDRLRGTFKTGFAKLLGLLDFKRKVVYVASGVTPGRKNFVTYHEITH